MARPYTQSDDIVGASHGSPLHGQMPTEDRRGEPWLALTRTGARMVYDPDKHRRRSIRRRGYDYTTQGAYFVTICVRGRKCLLGRVMRGQMHPSAFGQIVAECWDAIPNHFQHATLDAFAVMPNHVHGIIVLAHDRPPSAEVSGSIQTPSPSLNRSPRHSLGTIVGLFKSSAATRINNVRATPGVSFWQRNYYEHIVQSEADLARIRQYILTNPARWRDDEFDQSGYAVS